jgi:hypothetical protein
MSIRSRAFQLPMPGFVRRACIARLARITADAFGVPAPGVDGARGARRMRAREALEAYAAFSAQGAAALLRTGRGLSTAEARLFSNARDLGRRLRRALGIRTRAEGMGVARALYRMIRVDFRPTASAGAAPGGTAFEVPRCFFASHYSPAVCRLVSSLDAGLLAGLTDGGQLSFARRITEVASSCKGVIA